MKAGTHISRRTLTTLAIAVSACCHFSPVASGQQAKPAVGASARPESRTLIDVNSADARTLSTLPGVGPTIAQRIIDGRPYHSFADLAKVQGLNQAKVDALKGHVIIGSDLKREKPRNTATTATNSSTASVKAKPEAEAPSIKSGASSAKLAPSEKININTASADELDRLPGIGKTKAKAIIDYRTQNGPFKTLEDIQKVKGIKEGGFSKIKDHIKLAN